MFPKIKKRSSLCGFDWKEILKAEFVFNCGMVWCGGGGGVGVGVCVCVCVCVCVWNINSFDIIAIIFKAYKKCKSIKKDFKSAGLLI